MVLLKRNMIIKLFLITMCAVLIKTHLTMMDPFDFKLKEKRRYELLAVNNNQLLVVKNHWRILSAPITESPQADVHCKTFISCETCLQANLYSCGWCHNYGCVNNPQNYCPKAKHLVNSEQRHRNQTFCNAIAQNGAFINVDHGKVRIGVKMRISDPAIYQQDIKCLILLSGYKSVIVMTGWIVKDEVRCEQFYKPNLHYAAGTFQLFWGGALPDSRQIPLFLYSCEHLAKNCETCAKIPMQFRCGWCHGNRKCSSIAVCPTKWTTSNKLFCQSSAFNARRKYISFKVTQNPFEVFLSNSTPRLFYQFHAHDNIPLRLRRGEVSSHKGDLNSNEVTSENVIQNPNGNVNSSNPSATSR